MAEELYFRLKFDCHDDLAKFRDKLVEFLKSPPPHMGPSFTVGALVWATNEQSSQPRLYLTVPAVSAAQAVGLSVQASPIYVNEFPGDCSLLYGDQSDSQ